jgi:hypothetical protein
VIPYPVYIGFPAIVGLLRMLVHAALGGAFLWCAMLCTV